MTREVRRTPLKTSPFLDFVYELEDLVGTSTEPDALAADVGVALRKLLEQRDWLAPEHREPFSDRYRQHILYVSPSGAFSVVALVWRPGQRTPIHDHVAWCVVGVYEGAEHESRFLSYRDADTQFLSPVNSAINRVGDIAVRVPPNEDIHRVSNHSDGLSISIHVYGADIRKLGTSINHRFDDWLIRDDPANATPIQWRSVSNS